MESEIVTSLEMLSLSKPTSGRIVDYDCSSSSDEEDESPTSEASKPSLKENPPDNDALTVVPQKSSSPVKQESKGISESASISKIEVVIEDFPSDEAQENTSSSGDILQAFLNNTVKPDIQKVSNGHHQSTVGSKVPGPVSSCVHEQKEKNLVEVDDGTESSGETVASEDMTVKEKGLDSNIIDVDYQPGTDSGDNSDSISLSSLKPICANAETSPLFKDSSLTNVPDESTVLAVDEVKDAKNNSSKVDEDFDVKKYLHDIISGMSDSKLLNDSYSVPIPSVIYRLDKKGKWRDGTEMERKEAEVIVKDQETGDIFHVTPNNVKSASHYNAKVLNSLDNLDFPPNQRYSSERNRKYDDMNGKFSSSKFSSDKLDKRIKTSGEVKVSQISHRHQSKSHLVGPLTIIETKLDQGNKPSTISGISHSKESKLVVDEIDSSKLDENSKGLKKETKHPDVDASPDETISSTNDNPDASQSQFASVFKSPKLETIIESDEADVQVNDKEGFTSIRYKDTNDLKIKEETEVVDNSDAFRPENCSSPSPEDDQVSKQLEVRGSISVTSTFGEDFKEYLSKVGIDDEEMILTMLDTDDFPTDVFSFIRSYPVTDFLKRDVDKRILIKVLTLSDEDEIDGKVDEVLDKFVDISSCNLGSEIVLHLLNSNDQLREKIISVAKCTNTFNELLKSGAGSFVAFRCLPYLPAEDLLKIAHHLHIFDGLSNIPLHSWNFLEHLILQFFHLEVVQMIMDQIFHLDNMKCLVFHPGGKIILETIVKKSNSVIHLRFVVQWITQHLDFMLSEKTAASVVVSVIEILLDKCSETDQAVVWLDMLSSFVDKFADEASGDKPRDSNNVEEMFEKLLEEVDADVEIKEGTPIIIKAAKDHIGHTFVLAVLDMLDNFPEKSKLKLQEVLRAHETELKSDPYGIIIVKSKYGHM